MNGSDQRPTKGSERSESSRSGEAVHDGPARSGRLALVSGGSGGIGFACARRLAAKGYQLLLTARRPDPLARAAAEIGPAARWVAGDCSEEDDVERLVDGVERIDLLVHAAGILEGTIVRKQPVEVFDRVIRSNLRSTYLLSKYVVPKMEVGGRIIFISSLASLEGIPSLSAYSSAKAGMNALAQALAGEVERDGISVHLVIAGPVDTAMFGDHARKVVSLRPDDVADVVAWLDELDPRIAIRQIVLDPVATGPFADGKASVDRVVDPAHLGTSGLEDVAG